MRVSGTVWWFLAPFMPDDDFLSGDNYHIMYPEHNKRLFPQDNGSDLLGRCFCDPQVGLCCITRMGPLIQNNDQELDPTLHYRCLTTQAEYVATVAQIETWITQAPSIPRPQIPLSRKNAAPVTYPSYAPHEVSPIPAAPMSNPQGPMVPDGDGPTIGSKPCALTQKTKGL